MNIQQIREKIDERTTEFVADIDFRSFFADINGKEQDVCGCNELVVTQRIDTQIEEKVDQGCTELAIDNSLTNVPNEIDKEEIIDVENTAGLTCKTEYEDTNDISKKDSLSTGKNEIDKDGIIDSEKNTAGLTRKPEYGDTEDIFQEEPLSVSVIDCHGGRTTNEDRKQIMTQNERYTTYSELNELDIVSITSQSQELELFPYSQSSPSEPNSYPTASNYGLVKLSKSNKNHIGPKYIASNMTVVNPVDVKQKVCIGIFCVVIFVTVFILILVFVNKNVNSKTESVRKTYNATWTVPRDVWGADPLLVNYEYEIINIIEIIGITQTNTSACDNLQSCSEIVREIQKRDIEIMGAVDINYNFLIGGDGNIYDGRGWRGATSVSNLKYNQIRLAFIGDYSTSGRNDFLSIKQKTAFRLFLKKGLKMNISDSYLIFIECCTLNEPSFVGKNLFQFFYNAYYPMACFAFDTNYDLYNHCEFENVTFGE